MKLFKRFIPVILVAGFACASLDSCFIFHGKNHCGDCPNFKTNNKPKKPGKH